MRKLIDEKGRLGGKLSVVDLAILLLVLVIIAGAGFTFATRGPVEDIDDEIAGRDIPVRYTLQIAGVRHWTVNNLRVGDTLFIGAIDVGTIVSLETKPYQVLLADDGEAWWAELPERYVVIAQVESTATVIDGRVLIAESVRMSVSNTTMNFTSRYADFHASIKEFDFYDEP